MSNEELAWPEHFPKKCPPEESVPPQGEVFRFVATIPPTDYDFKSLFDLRSQNKDFGSLSCNSRGLSVLITLEDSLGMASRVPALKKKIIAFSNLPPESGLICKTKSKNCENHHTFWNQYSSDQLIPLFSEVEVNSEGGE